MKKILKQEIVNIKETVENLWIDIKSCNKDEYWDKEKSCFVPYTKWRNLPLYMKLGIIGGLAVVINWLING